jgi:AsmA family protein
MDLAASRHPGGRRALIIVGALLLVLIVFIALFDWNWLRGPVEKRVTAATGRELSIGDLDVDLGLRPRVRAQDVHFANAGWSQEPEMASIGTLEFSVYLPALLRGRVDLPYVHLDAPRLLIERNGQGRGNWQFEGPGQETAGGRPPVIRDLTVKEGRLVVREARLNTNLDLTLRSVKRRDGQERAPLVAAGQGTFRGQPFELNGTIDSPLDLRNSERPFHVDVRASVGETQAHASGASRTPLQFDAFTIHVDVAGPNLGDLWPLAGLPLPDTPPYALQGELAHDEGVWAYRDFKGKVGDSDMSGDVLIDVRGKRPLLRADVESRNLDFDDLGGLVNAPPSTKPGETASEEQRRQAQELKAKPRVLPDKPYDLGKFRVMDADVRFKADRVDAPKLPLERISAHLVLKDGVAKFDPLDFDAAGGRITSRMSLDATRPSIQTTMAIEVQHLELPKLFPSVEITKAGAGKISGAIALDAQGNSIAHMLGSANGDVGFIMGPGRISNLLLELAGLDVAESLKYLLDKNKEVGLRCAYAAFKVEDGVARTQALAFDTTDTLLFGQGTVDLRAEKLDLRLEAKPKDVSPISLRGPLHIGGTLKDPSVLPEPAPLAGRVAVAAALYAITPPAALLALIETGPGKDKRIDCGPAQREGS